MRPLISARVQVRSTTEIGTEAAPLASQWAPSILLTDLASQSDHKLNYESLIRGLDVGSALPSKIQLI